MKREGQDIVESFLAPTALTAPRQPGDPASEFSLCHARRSDLVLA